MLEFARLSGLSPAVVPPQRYLWTDAFAVCNFLELYRQTGDGRFRQLATLLVDQVHAVLGRRRRDDERGGWISGLDEREGALHPTIGGLRIGKEMNERAPGEPFDERLEWERDGQYYHYLTQWMHALDRVGRVTDDPVYNRWAIELAKRAHAGFVHTHPPGGPKRMYWKMSIDLSYPLVPSMGLHDPLDGLVAYSEIQASAQRYAGETGRPDLKAEIVDMAQICEGRNWTTDDPLGIGGLLIDAFKMGQLIVTTDFTRRILLEDVLGASLDGLNSFERMSPLESPARHRLAFRELGLSIGLQALERLWGLSVQHPETFERRRLPSLFRGLMRYMPLRDVIHTFWLEQKNRESGSWNAHRNINMVMLATSLAPEGYLSLL